MDLLIIGASARAAAQSARRGGCRPMAIDLFGDEDLRTAAERVEVVSLADYPNRLPAIAATLPDMPWMYVGGLEAHPRVIDEIAQARPLLGVHSFQIEQIRDPELLNGIAAEWLLPLPEMRKSLGDLPAESRVDNWVIKSIHSSGGLHVRPATASAHLAKNEYLQELVSGDCLSAAYVANGLIARLLGITQQLIGTRYGAPRPFQYAGNIGPIEVGTGLTTELRDYGEGLAEEFRLTGLFGVDLKRLAGAADQWNTGRTLEVNPRYTSGMEVLELSGVVSSMVGLHIAGSSGSLPREQDFLHPAKCVTGKLVLYAPSAGQLSSRWREEIECPPGVEWADVPLSCGPFAAGEPVVTAICQRATADEVHHTLLATRDAFLRRWQSAF